MGGELTLKVTVSLRGQLRSTVMVKLRPKVMYEKTTKIKGKSLRRQLRSKVKSERITKTKDNSLKRQVIV